MPKPRALHDVRRQADRNREEGRVRCAKAEIVFTDFATGGEDRAPHPVRAVGVLFADAGLLYAGKDREGQAPGERCNSYELPAGGQFLAQRAEEAHAVERQSLDEADGKGLRNVEDGNAFFWRPGDGAGAVPSSGW